MPRTSLIQAMERCLFVGPRFFGYEDDIAEAIARTGLAVDYVDERPTNSSWVRAVLRIKPSVIGEVVRRYFSQQLEILGDRSYSYIFVLKGEVVPLSFLEKLKELNPEARFIFYTFDSISNSSNFLSISHIFDRKFSFDYKDCESIQDLELLPLFYTNDFFVSEREADRDTKLAFVGTLHSGRHAAVTALSKHFEPVIEYFYCPAKWFYWLSRYLTREFKNVPLSSVSFEKMSRESVASVFQRSKAVLDIQREGQTGLTMRTFEVLASGSGLITTNKYIDRLPQSLRNRVLYIESLSEDKAVAQVAEFLEALNSSPYVSEDVVEYSIDKWAMKLLGHRNGSGVELSGPMQNDRPAAPSDEGRDGK